MESSYKQFNSTTDLVFSDEDGWYFQQFENGSDRSRTSQDFSSEGKARLAWRDDRIQWSEWR